MADWIESHAALREHPKRKRLSRCLDLETHATVGLLHCLWWWAMDYAPDGDLADFDPADIADGIGYPGDPKKLIKGLQDAKFLDGLRLHDWQDYGEKLHRRRAANAKRMREAREREAKEAEEEAKKAALQAPHSDHVQDTCGARADHVQDTCETCVGPQTDRQTGQTDRKPSPKEEAAAVAREEERSSLEEGNPRDTLPPYLTDEPDPMDALLVDLWAVPGWKRSPKQDREDLGTLGKSFPRADLATAIQQLRAKAADGAVKTNPRSALQAFVKQLHLSTPARIFDDAAPPGKPTAAELKEQAKQAAAVAAKFRAGVRA